MDGEVGPEKSCPDLLDNNEILTSCVSVVLNQLQLCPQPTQRSQLETFLTIRQGKKGSATGIQQAEAREAAKQPTLHAGQVPPNNSASPKVRS